MNATNSWLSALCLAFVVMALSTGNTLAQTGPSLTPAVGAAQVYLPVLNKRPATCTVRTDPNILGVQMYGATGNMSPYYSWLKATGADWVRVSVPWESLEPTDTTPDKYNWRVSDLVLAAAIEGCYTLIATHDISPRWAASPPLSQSGPILRSSVLDLIEYLAAMVERYDGDGLDDAPRSPIVNYWELYNEPDASSRFVGHGGWGEYGGTGGDSPPSVSYAEMLAAVVPAMRQANPNVKILLGGLAYTDFIEEHTDGKFVRSFLDDVLTAGGGAYFDYMSFHSYAEMGKPWRPPGIIERAAELRGIMGKHGLSKPLIVSETGWYSNSTAERTSSQEIQARYLTELYAHGKAANIRTLVNFTLADLDDYPHDTGLVTSAYTGGPITPKAALKAFQTVSSMLQDAEYIGKVDSVAEVEAHEFADQSLGRAIYVAWLYPVTSTGKASLTLPIYGADLYDIYNNFVGTGTASDGTLTIKVTAQPVYVIEK